MINYLQNPYKNSYIILIHSKNKALIKRMVRTSNRNRTHKHSRINKLELKLLSQQSIEHSESKYLVGCLIKSANVHYIVVNTLGEYAKLKNLNSGDLFSSGVYAVEYNPEHAHFLRVQALPSYKDEEKDQYKFDPSYFFAGDLDPNSERNRPIHIIRRA